ncbi:MAG: outer membrane beta-barrel protein [Gammaproteobacteria bacterium]
MKTQKLPSLALLFSLCNSAAALAEEPKSWKDVGFYLGAGLGTADVSEDNIDFDDSDIAYKIILGYQINPTWAIEGGYVDFGQPDEGMFEVDPTGVDFFGVGGFLMGPMRIFGKLGLISWNYDVSASGTFGYDDEGIDVAAGVGLEFELFSLGVRGELEYFDIADGIQMFSVGATYTF